MAFTDQVREWVRAGTDQTKRQSTRGKRWVDLRRLDRQVSKERAALGEVVEGFLEDGRPSLEASEIQGNLERLRQLRERRDAIREQPEQI